MSVTTLLVSLLLHILLRYTGGATITSPPQDATTLFGDTAVFNCTGEGDLLQWTYDGTTVDGQVAQERQISIVHHNVSDGMVSSSLYINATIENDGVGISCIVVSFSPFDLVSDGAILTVIRISAVLLPSAVLAVPSGINGNGDNNNVTVMLEIMWNPPSTVSPNIGTLQYDTTIQTGNTSTTITTTDTYILYNIQYCVLYNITITAFGIDNSYSQTIHFSDPISLHCKNEMVNLTHGGLTWLHTCQRSHIIICV